MAYAPDWNLINAPVIGKWGTLHGLALPVIFIVTFFWYCSQIILRRTFFPLMAGRFFRHATIFIFCALMLIQILNQGRFLGNMFKHLVDKNMSGKQSILLGRSYDFSNFVKKICPFQSHGLLLTDYNGDQALEVWVLKYFLFPHVNLIDQSNMYDCVIIFYKDRPESFVPDGYRIAGYFDEKSLVAVKK